MVAAMATKPIGFKRKRLGLPLRKEDRQWLLISVAICFYTNRFFVPEWAQVKEAYLETENLFAWMLVL